MAAPKIYSWSPVAHATPMVWVNPLAADPAAEPYGECITFTVGVLSTQYIASWMSAYFASVKARGGSISLIASDAEDSGPEIGWFSDALGIGDIQKSQSVDAWLAVPANLTNYPMYHAELSATPQADNTNMGTNYSRALQWNRYADYRKTQHLIQNVRVPLRNVFPNARFSQYGEVPNGTLDFNGWQSLSDGTIDGTYTPAMYIWPGNVIRYHNPALTKSVRWNSMIEILSVLRQCLRDASGNRVIVWISFPDFNGGGVPFNLSWWRELIRHIEAMGIDTILYWNPAEANGNETFAASVLPLLQTKPLQANLPDLSYDAASVTTADYTTSYLGTPMTKNVFWDNFNRPNQCPPGNGETSFNSPAPGNPVFDWSINTDKLLSPTGQYNVYLRFPLASARRSQRIEMTWTEGATHDDNLKLIVRYNPTGNTGFLVYWNTNTGYYAHTNGGTEFHSLGSASYVVGNVYKSRMDIVTNLAGTSSTITCTLRNETTGTVLVTGSFETTTAAFQDTTLPPALLGFQSIVDKVEIFDIEAGNVPISTFINRNGQDPDDPSNWTEGLPDSTTVVTLAATDTATNLPLNWTAATQVNALNIGEIEMGTPTMFDWSNLEIIGPDIGTISDVLGDPNTYQLKTVSGDGYLKIAGTKALLDFSDREVTGTLHFLETATRVVRPTLKCSGTIIADGNLVIEGGTTSGGVDLAGADIIARGGLTIHDLLASGTGTANVASTTLKGRSVSLIGTTGTPAAVIQSIGHIGKTIAYK